MAILIIATEHDPHTVAVTKEIDARGGEYVVADLSEFPQHAQLAVRFTCCGDRDLGITLRGRRIDLGAIGSAWWRRPQQPRISAEVQGETHRLFAANETAEALAGLWHALDCYWVNEPRADHVAHRKDHAAAGGPGRRAPAPGHPHHERPRRGPPVHRRARLPAGHLQVVLRPRAGLAGDAAHPGRGARAHRLRALRTGHLPGVRRGRLRRAHHDRRRRALPGRDPLPADGLSDRLPHGDGPCR